MMNTNDPQPSSQPAPAARSADPNQRFGRPGPGWRAQLYAIIFESDTPIGRAFDLVLSGAILLSVLVVVLTTVEPVARAIGPWLTAAE